MKKPIFIFILFALNLYVFSNSTTPTSQIDQGYMPYQEIIKPQGKLSLKEGTFTVLDENEIDFPLFKPAWSGLPNLSLTYLFTKTERMTLKYYNVLAKYKLGVAYAAISGVFAGFSVTYLAISFPYIFFAYIFTIIFAVMSVCFLIPTIIFAIASGYQFKKSKKLLQSLVDDYNGFFSQNDNEKYSLRISLFIKGL
ncbi:MAG: hypothetical protein A2086_01130 [Spirochaetes bacterium GWD1_27_9]|nr:MAG: hypothetical protein A2Z98_16060 [Spirochaetes bacterium GWB1_27_13]OHD27979.1 MAG: hypothetical protein A2Y34_11470 [Spirochaetes bacterium GWC1_27_15]OHD33655.1 MAG: hypothetical protein A2086_01130 [Spirochaetes bacterium GWD1_27_9]